jgi:hypothetical protein
MKIFRILKIVAGFEPELPRVMYDKYFNVNKIAESLEKANKILETCKGNGNVDAITTWERIVASLQMKWRDAMVEVNTNGKYSFE